VSLGLFCSFDIFFTQFSQSHFIQTRFSFPYIFAVRKRLSHTHAQTKWHKHQMGEIIKINDVCRLTGYGRRSIYLFVKSGKLKCYQPAGRLLFKKEDVENFLNQKK